MQNLHSQALDEAAWNGEPESNTAIRLMTEADLPTMIAIDAQVVGYRREAYFEEKIAACLSTPGINTSLAAEIDGRVVGFLIGQVFYGEFGIASPRAVLDTIGVHPSFRRLALARNLVEQFRKNMEVLRLEAIDTLVEWNRHDLLGFFQSMGFRPSRDQDLVWNLDKYPFTAKSSDVVIRPVTYDDIVHIVSIDLEVVPASRKLYFTAKLKACEARLDSSVFLVAELDGELVGFVVGSLYHGEFGIDTTRGVIDSMGVRQTAQHKGVGSAILENLCSRAHKAGVHQIETLVRWNNWEVLQFFEYAGFRPSTRMNLEWRLS